MVLAVDLVLAVDEELAVHPFLTNSPSLVQSLKSPAAYMDTLAGSVEDAMVKGTPVPSPTTQAIHELVCGASRVASLSGSFADAVFQEARSSQYY